MYFQAVTLNHLNFFLQIMSPSGWAETSELPGASKPSAVQQSELPDEAVESEFNRGVKI